MDTGVDLNCEFCARYGRPLLEELVLLGVGTSWYWWDEETNAVDWDFSNRFSRRLSPDEIRFDNNHYTINNLVHPLDGAAYYVVGRANHLGVGESVLLAVLTSGMWEVVVEFRERISINDLIMTPAGGVVMGEFVFKLGDYLNSAPGGGNWLQQLLGATLGFPVAVHDWMDGRRRSATATDALGYSRRYEHAFRLAWHSGEVVDGEVPFDAQGVELSAELNSLPGRHRPRLSRFFNQADFTELSLRASWTEEDASDFDLRVATTLLGWYGQAYEEVGGGRSGGSLRVGLGMAFEHVQRWAPDPRDRIGIAHGPGPVFDLKREHGPFRLRIGAAAHPDFAAIDALAFPAWQSSYPHHPNRSVVEAHGYYLAVGASVRVEAHVGWGPLELGGRARAGRYDSIDGLDREQELVVDELHLQDTMLEHAAWTAAHLPGGVLAKVEVEWSNRKGAVQDLEVVRARRRLSGSLGLTF